MIINICRASIPNSPNGTRSNFSFEKSNNEFQVQTPSKNETQQDEEIGNIYQRNNSDSKILNAKYQDFEKRDLSSIDVSLKQS